MERKTLVRCALCVGAVVVCVQCAQLMRSYDTPGKLSVPKASQASTDTGQPVVHAITGTEYPQPAQQRPSAEQSSSSATPRFTIKPEPWPRDT